jgi:hypothetical protein
MKPRTTIIPPEPRHPFDFRSMHAMYRALVSLLRIQVVTGAGDKPDILYSESNVTIVLPQSGAGTVDIAGEWNPATAYKAKTIVFFTPDGGSAGTYYSLQAVPAGISPDTGAPNWAAFPNSPPGVWA